MKLSAFEPKVRSVYSSSRIAAVAGAVATLVVGRFLAARLELGPVDDAYISLRYAAQLVAGEGLVFNPGERVEGFTNLLLVLLEAGAIRLGLRPETAMVGFGWGGLVALAATTSHFAATRIFVGQWLAPACVGLGVALNPVLLCWAGSGLETALYAEFVLAAAILAADESGRGRPLATVAALLVAALTRPEAVALFPVFVLAIGLRRPRSGAVVFAAVFVAGLAALTAWRWIYFGQILPNTFYAKLDYGGALLAQRGAGYVIRFLGAVWILAAAAVATSIRVRSAPRWVGVFLALAAAQIAVVVYEGGDHFAAFRFMAPVWPLLALLAMASFVRLGDWLGDRYGDRAGEWRGEKRGVGFWPRRGAALAALTALALAGFGVAHSARPGEPERELERFVREVVLSRNWTSLGRLLARDAPAGASLGTVAIGAVGYYSGLRIVDPHGIVDSAVSRLETELGGGYAGHEKFDVDDLLARRPDFLLIISLPTPQPLTEAQVRSLAWGDFSRALVRHPGFRERYRLAALRDGDVFWNFHVRRDLPAIESGGHE